jgi:hypothetical protein
MADKATRAMADEQMAKLRQVQNAINRQETATQSLIEQVEAIRRASSTTATEQKTTLEQVRNTLDSCEKTTESLTSRIEKTVKRNIDKLKRATSAMNVQNEVARNLTQRM